MAIKSRLVRWALRHALHDVGHSPQGGLLVWVDADGVAWELGAYTPDQLERIGEAVDVAYRSTRERSLKVRLAAACYPGRKLATKARGLPRP